MRVHTCVQGFCLLPFLKNCRTCTDKFDCERYAYRWCGACGACDVVVGCVWCGGGVCGVVVGCMWFGGGVRVVWRWGACGGEVGCVWCVLLCNSCSVILCSVVVCDVVVWCSVV